MLAGCISAHSDIISMWLVDANSSIEIMVYNYSVSSESSPKSQIHQSVFIRMHQ